MIKGLNALFEISDMLNGNFSVKKLDSSSRSDDIIELIQYS